MKKITTDMIMSKRPCEEWSRERIQKFLGSGKTVLEILAMRKIPADERIWAVTKFLPEKVNRKFAIWCARQCETEVIEIKKYRDVIEQFYNGTATKEELAAARGAAYRAAYWASDWAADRVAYWAAYRASYWAADRAADWAADRAAYWAAVRKKQIKKLQKLIKEEESDE